MIGKFWHRHRRPRPVEYNSDPSFHSGLKQKEAEALKTPASKKKGGAAALRAAATAAASSAAVSTVGTPAGADASEPQTPGAGRTNGDGNRKDKERDDDDVSTASSASEAPLAHKVKINGGHQQRTSSPIPASTPTKSEMTKNGISASSSVSESASTSTAFPAPQNLSKIHVGLFVFHLCSNIHYLYLFWGLLVASRTQHPASTMALESDANYARKIPQ